MFCKSTKLVRSAHWWGKCSWGGGGWEVLPASASLRLSPGLPHSAGLNPSLLLPSPHNITSCFSLAYDYNPSLAFELRNEFECGHEAVKLLNGAASHLRTRPGGPIWSQYPTALTFSPLSFFWMKLHLQKMPKFVVFIRAIQNIAWIAKADQCSVTLRL